MCLGGAWGNPAMPPPSLVCLSQLRPRRAGFGCHWPNHPYGRHDHRPLRASPKMQAVRMKVHIMSFRRVKLYDAIFLIPKCILHPAHFRPCRTTVREAYTAMFPATAIRCDDTCAIREDKKAIVTVARVTSEMTLSPTIAFWHMEAHLSSPAISHLAWALDSAGSQACSVVFISFSHFLICFSRVTFRCDRP